MFVANEASRSISWAKSSRRRHRTSSDSSFKPPKAKRHRSLVKSDPPGGPQSNSSLIADQSPNFGNRADFGQRQGTGTTYAIDLHREQIPSGDLSGHSAVLAQNDYYTISQLPAVPDQISDSNTSTHIQCGFLSDTGYALALTETSAVIWSYAAPDLNVGTNIITVTIPESCKGTSQPGTLGALVSNNSAYSVPGLLLLNASTGEISYWETALNGDATGLTRQRIHQAEGTIPGLSSGETALSITNAEPSGLIVTFSSGKVAHIALRDSFGKPSISATLLRTSITTGKHGLLQGLRNVLGGVRRKDSVIVRPGISRQRGQRDLILVSSSGLCEIRDTHVNGVNTFRGKFDLRSGIDQAFGNNCTLEHCEHDIKIFDLSVVKEPHSAPPEIGQGDDCETDIFFLASSTDNKMIARAAIIKASLCGTEVKFVSTYCIDDPEFFKNIDQYHPKLHVPATGEIAFVIVGQLLILKSLVYRENSPSAQLLNESKCPLTTFQDRVQFRDEARFEILNSDIERQKTDNRNPTCLLLIRGCGIARIEVLPRTEIDVDGDCDGLQLTAKQKLEQAVFYGSLSESPLDLGNIGCLTSAPEDLEDAALTICREILQSASRFLSHVSPSLDQQFRLRSKALSDLAALLYRQKVSISRQGRWEILWSAEKLAAQRTLWNVESEFRKEFGESQTFLFHVLTLMKDKFKTTRRKSKETAGIDIVQHWCIHDTDQMEHVIPWITNALRDPRTRTRRDNCEPFQQIRQASELSLAVLEAAFRFRESHVNSFGMIDEDFDDGVLLSTYEKLSEFWTSQSMVYSETENLLDLELDSCRSWMQASMSSERGPDNTIQLHIARNTVRHMRIIGKMHRERIQWLSAQKTPKSSDERTALIEAHLKNRRWQIFKMAGIGQLEEAILLAEEFRDMNALVELMVELQDQLETQDDSNNCNTTTVSPSEPNKADFDAKVNEYFGKFGEAWADVFFARYRDLRQFGSLLAMKQYQEYITRFLKKSKRFSGWAWINDVIGENDYRSASDALKSLALDHESSLWTMRVGASLAKLSILAAEEDQSESGRAADEQDVQNLDSITEIGGIQEVVYEHVLPALHGAIDQKAELDLAIEHFACHTTRDRPAMRELLEQALSNLLTRKVLPPEQLIDLLTLMDSTRFLEGEDDGVAGREFYFALRVLNLSGELKTDPPYYDFILKTIWRRCFIRDDWLSIQQTGEGETTKPQFHIGSTSLLSTLQECDTNGNVYNIVLESYFADFLKYEAPGKHVVSLDQPSPSETLRSPLDNPTYRGRFRTDQWVHILRDLEQERETLRLYIERGNLDAWFYSLLPRKAQEANSGVTVGASIQPITHLPDEPASKHLEGKVRLNWL